MDDQKKRRILIIANPVAGPRSCRKFDKIVEILRKNNISVNIRKTEYPGHGKLIAREYVNNDFDMIVAAGGDGTINEVLNGIYPHQIPFGLIPLGTVNVLAKEIHLKNKPENIAECIIKGHVAPCWLGLSNDQYFSLMVSVGLDSMSVAHVNTKLKKYIGRGAYILSFIWQVIKSKNITYRVTADGKIYDTSNVIVTNGRLYGGEYNCAPDARLDDNQLYLLLAKKSGRLNALRYAYLMLSQKYPYSDSVTILPITKITIKCNYENIPVQIDGDNAGCLPANISISNYSINLVQPEKSP